MLRYFLILMVTVVTFLTFSQTAHSRGKSFKVEGVYQEASEQFRELAEKEDRYAEEKNAERDAKRAEPVETTSNSSTSTNNETSDNKKSTKAPDNQKPTKENETSSTISYAGSCSVYVRWSDGGNASGVRVSGHISAFGGGGMTKAFKTRNGVADITWTSNNALDEVYVDGKNVGSSSNGGSISYRMN